MRGTNCAYNSTSKVDNRKNPATLLLWMTLIWKWRVYYSCYIVFLLNMMVKKYTDCSAGYGVHRGDIKTTVGTTAKGHHSIEEYSTQMIRYNTTLTLQTGRDHRDRKVTRSAPGRRRAAAAYGFMSGRFLLKHSSVLQPPAVEQKEDLLYTPDSI